MIPWWVEQAKPGPLLRPILGFLTMLSWVYGGLCRIRLFLYRYGFLKVRKLDTRVVSIGNLTVGGTGKTPLVIALAEYLHRKGLKVGILSRGYKGERAEYPRWVSDGKTVLIGPRQAGDEPYLMALRLRSVPVIVGKDRYRSGQSLIDQFKPDVILLDDGFQYLRLHRDLDLLVVDGISPWGPGPAKEMLLPRGILREPLREVRRATAVLITRLEQCDQRPAILERIRFYHPEVPVFGAFFRPTVLIHPASGSERSVMSLKGQPVLSFSGIGQPPSFRGLLNRLDAQVVSEAIFEDHHVYTLEDLRELLQRAETVGAQILVTTEKDAVKIRDFLKPEDPVWALRIDLDRIEDPLLWERFIRERIKVA